jgi:hypothetical protein
MVHAVETLAGFRGGSLVLGGQRGVELSRARVQVRVPVPVQVRAPVPVQVQVPVPVQVRAPVPGRESHRRDRQVPARRSR